MIVHEPDFIFWARYVETLSPIKKLKNKWGGDTLSIAPTLASTNLLMALLKQGISSSRFFKLCSFRIA